VRAQPGSQQRPKALDGVDVDLAEPVPVLVAGILAAPVADRLVPMVLSGLAPEPLVGGGLASYKPGLG
jgi:hypothetical protein